MQTEPKPDGLELSQGVCLGKGCIASYAELGDDVIGVWITNPENPDVPLCVVFEPPIDILIEGSYGEGSCYIVFADNSQPPILGTIHEWGTRCEENPGKRSDES